MFQIYSILLVLFLNCDIISEKIVKQVMNACNIPHINKTQSSFCTACCLSKIHRFPFQLSESVYDSPL